MRVPRLSDILARNSPTSPKRLASGWNGRRISSADLCKIFLRSPECPVNGGVRPGRRGGAKVGNLSSVSVLDGIAPIRPSGKNGPFPPFGGHGARRRGFPGPAFRAWRIIFTRRRKECSRRRAPGLSKVHVDVLFCLCPGMRDRPQRAPPTAHATFQIAVTDQGGFGVMPPVARCSGSATPVRAGSGR